MPPISSLKKSFFGSLAGLSYFQEEERCWPYRSLANFCCEGSLCGSVYVNIRRSIGFPSLLESKTLDATYRKNNERSAFILAKDGLPSLDFEA